MRSFLSVFMLLFVLQPAMAEVTVSLPSAQNKRLAGQTRLRQVAAITGSDRFLVDAIGNLRLSDIGQGNLSAKHIRTAIEKEGLDTSGLTVKATRGYTPYAPSYGTGATHTGTAGANVHRPRGPYRAGSMDAAVRGHIAERYGLPAKRVGWRPVYTAMSPRITDTQGAQFVVSDMEPGKGRHQYHVTVHILRDGKTISEGGVDIQAWTTRDWLVFKHAMKAGEVVAAGDVELRPVLVYDFGAKPEVRLKRVVGARLLRGFGAGTRISTDFLGGKLAVKKGDHIRIRVRTASFSVGMTAVSLEDGSEGGVVAAELQATGKHVYVRLTGSGNGQLVADPLGNDGE